MLVRHPSTVLVGVILTLGLVHGVRAQEPSNPVYDEDFLAEFDNGPDRPNPTPWVGWHGPLDDGLLGLRFGMDRFAVGRNLRERGLQGLPARAQTQRFEGKILGHTGEVLTDFRPDVQAPKGERLSRIQIAWRIDGLPNRALDLFESLRTMLEARYGDPLLSEEDGYSALDSGWGSFRRGYAGPQARALLVVEAIRNQRFRVVILVESPQLHVDVPR